VLAGLVVASIGGVPHPMVDTQVPTGSSAVGNFSDRVRGVLDDCLHLGECHVAAAGPVGLPARRSKGQKLIPGINAVIGVAINDNGRCLCLLL
jgi:hypothetical protein